MLPLLTTLALAAPSDTVARGVRFEGGPCQVLWEGGEVPLGGIAVLDWERLASRGPWLTGYRLGLGVTATGGSGDALDPAWVPVGLVEGVFGRTGAGWYVAGAAGVELLLILPMPTVSVEAGGRVAFDSGGAVLVGPMVRAAAWPSADPILQVSGGVGLSLTWGRNQTDQQPLPDP